MNPERILRLPDDFIRELGTRASGIVDYRIGRSITVSYRGGERFLCHTCQGANRYRDKHHKGCAHCVRVARFRDEHLEVLNVVVADPALEVPIAS